jgi:acyl-CoA synthetase (AMP-forming)/AMP-acid ligase II
VLAGVALGWFRSGDIAELDAEGFIFIRDRAKDIIIRGGTRSNLRFI